MIRHDSLLREERYLLSNCPHIDQIICRTISHGNRVKNGWIALYTTIQTFRCTLQSSSVFQDILLFEGASRKSAVSRSSVYETGKTDSRRGNDKKNRETGIGRLRIRTEQASARRGYHFCRAFTKGAYRRRRMSNVQYPGKRTYSPKERRSARNCWATGHIEKRDHFGRGVFRSSPGIQTKRRVMNIERILRTVCPHFLGLSDRGFVYGPHGRLLHRNLEEHWFSHCVTMPSYNVFLSDAISDTLQFLQNNSMNDAPLGIATLASSKSTWNEHLLSSGHKVSLHKTVKINLIVDASESKNLLYKKQRERKVWWRKLAQSPSRFAIADAKKSKNIDAVEIEAQFPFGNITVETIVHYPNIRRLYPQTDSNKDNSTDVHMIEHVSSLDWGCLAMLCDSYMSNDNSTRAYIHPKLSPYKTTFHIEEEENKTNANIEELNRFVLYLNSTLRKNGIHTILNKNMEQTAETCLIPFVVSVNKTSLKNGIVHVKNRSTTLSEAVHITDLIKYITLRSS